MLEVIVRQREILSGEKRKTDLRQKILIDELKSPFRENADSTRIGSRASGSGQVRSIYTANQIKYGRRPVRPCVVTADQKYLWEHR
jgi:hypothetical protein